MEFAAIDTPFKDLLHTNAVPSDAECQRIHELLAGPRKEVDKITDEIERLQTLINELAGKRARLTEFIDAHLALVSPARRLPEDVVAEIFTAALPSDRNAVMSGAESPLLLCHVCQAWRRLALATPCLWATLHIVAPGTPSELLEVNERIGAWLSRSGSLPLSISIVRSQTARFEFDISKLVEILIRFSNRWKHLHLLLLSHLSFLPLAALAADDVPLLQSVVIDGFSNWLPPADIDSDIMSFMSTNLLRLSLRTPHFLDFPVRWDQLRHLSIGHDPHRSSRSANAVEVLSILRHCPDLETCTVVINSNMQDAGQAGCRMEKLWQLCVVDRGSSPEFFRVLVLPNLRSLEYSTLLPHDGDALAFTPLLTSTNHIECLSLSIPYAPTSIFPEILHLTPMLQELSLQWEPIATPDSDGDLLTLLTPSTSDSRRTLCPHLRVLNLLHFAALTDQTLLEFIRARTGTHLEVASLSSIHATFSRLMQLDIIPQLQPFIGAGMKVSLRYNPPLSLYSPSEARQTDDADWTPISSRWGEVFHA